MLTGIHVCDNAVMLIGIHVCDNTVMLTGIHVCDNTVMLYIHVLLLNVKFVNEAHTKFKIYCTNISARCIHSEGEGRMIFFFPSSDKLKSNSRTTVSEFKRTLTRLDELR